MKNISTILFLILLLPKSLWAEDIHDTHKTINHSGHSADHQQIFHAFTLEAEAGKAL